MRKIFFYLSALTVGVLQVACEPTQLEGPSTGPAISAADLKITKLLKTDGGQANTYIVKNESPITGISLLTATGGIVKSIDDNTLEIYSAFPGTIKIALTHITNGGTASITDSIIVTEGDPAVLSTPWYTEGAKFLTGGSDGTGSRTWVVDSLSKGHLGVGPNAAKPTEWWSANPMDKRGNGIYDDEITFTLSTGGAVLHNGGNSYVTGPYKDESYFSNPIKVGNDYMVNYTPPTNGGWVFNNTDSTLVLSGATPLVMGLYAGAKGGKYYIRSISDTKLELSTQDAKDAGLWWALVLIPKE